MYGRTYHLRFGKFFKMRSFSLTNKDGVLAKAWETCCEAYVCNGPFIVQDPQRPDFVFIAFPGCNNLHDMAAQDEFGECRIDRGNPHFTSFKSTVSEEVAIVYEPALKRLLYILENTDLKNKIKEWKNRGRSILLTGHSVGGAVAALATAWLLETEIQEHNVGPLPICITFGSPLFGNDIFGQAIRRERWAAQFFHIISRYDVVPRILLAPFKSISKPLEALLPYWQRSMCDSSARCASLRSQFRLLDPTMELLSCVMRHASAVASYRSAMCMAPNNMLLSGVSSAVKLSPYRPFGCYIFVSERGVIFTENYEAVQQILFYWLQSSDPCLVAEACISDHISYGSRLQDLLNLMEIDADFHHDNMSVPKQMETLGLEKQNIEVRVALQAAGEAMERLRNNSAKKAAELGNMRASMEEIEAYRKSSKAMGVSYYDLFKLHKDKRAFEANLARLHLAGFWDEVKDMAERRELPDDFAWDEEWIKAGTVYRMLVEPLDIANFYRLGKHEETGHYLGGRGRPRRYMVLEKWLRLFRRSQSGCSDSTLWAHFEELSYTMTKSGGRGEDGHELSPEVKSKVEKFEERVKAAIDSKKLCEDFVVEESSFVKWWKRLPPPFKSRSPLHEFMEGGGRQTYRAANIL